MLILTRRIGEVIMINDDIEITYLGIKGTQLRVGINAPRDVSIHRKEIYNKIKTAELSQKNNNLNSGGMIEMFGRLSHVPC